MPKSLARLDLSRNGIEAVYVLVAVTSKLHVVHLYMFSNGGVFVDNTLLSFIFQNSKRLCHQSNLHLAEVVRDGQGCCGLRADRAVVG